jgi:hypothetical protein
MNSIISKERLIIALGEGLLLLIKYSFLLIVIWYAFNFSLQTRQAAINGEQAAVAIHEYQLKGILPKFPILDKPKQ